MNIDGIYKLTTVRCRLVVSLFNLNSLSDLKSNKNRLSPSQSNNYIASVHAILDIEYIANAAKRTMKT